jgi:hypothetical protein
MGTLVISGLITKRAELVKALKAHDKAREDLVWDIEAVDRAIVLCGQKKPTPVTLFAKWQLRQMVGEIRHEFPDMESKTEITREVIKRMGWDVNDRRLLTNVRQKVKDCCNTMRAYELRKALRMARQTENQE